MLNRAFLSLVALGLCLGLQGCYLVAHDLRVRDLQEDKTIGVSIGMDRQVARDAIVMNKSWRVSQTTCADMASKDWQSQVKPPCADGIEVDTYLSGPGTYREGYEAIALLIKDGHVIKMRRWGRYSALMGL